MVIQANTAEEPDEIASLVEAWNETLESAGRASANTAFNLGFLIGLIPAVIIVIVAFIGAEWIAAFLTSILMVLALILFSNLVAYIAKSKAIERTFQNIVSIEIKEYCDLNKLTLVEFNNLANQILPGGSAMLSYTIEAIQEEPDTADKLDQTEE